MTRHRSCFTAIVFLGCAAALAGCGSDDVAGQIAPTAQAASATAPDGNNPVNLDGEIRHAQLQRTSHDLNGAVHTLSQLMLAAPDDPRVVGEYGKVLAEQGRAQEAMQFLTRATQLQSNDWSIYSALGVAYDQLGRQSDARAAYEQALALKPNEPSVLNNYALSRLLANDPVSARHLMAMAASAGGASDPKIARNIALVDSLAPMPVDAPAIAMAPVAPAAALNQPRALMPASTQVAVHPLAPVASAAPRVVMQAVPFDPLSGPVAASHPPRKLSAVHPVRAARHVAARAVKKPALAATSTPSVTPVAAAAVKPAPKKLTKKDAPPSLRMTADARTP